MRALFCSLSVLALVACDDKGSGDDSGVEDTGDTNEPDDTDTPAPEDADGDGFTAEDGDCDDANPAAYPDAAEVCDGADNDCDDLTDDEDDGVTGQGSWYNDGDGDGYGDGDPLLACDAPAGSVEASGDCDDADAALSPGEAEVCDGADNDCDGLTDDDDGSVTGEDTWYRDDDGDGFGSGDATMQACDQPAGYLGSPGDCDDADDLIYPGAPETCDSIDEDCDGAIDEDAIDLGTFYLDSDNDGYGDGASGVAACESPPGYLDDGSDCDDADPAVNPGASEIYYDGIDQDCDGGSDNDADGDGHDDAALGGDDCDDADSQTHPGAKEDCLDGLDTDCDGLADEEETCSSCADFSVIAYYDSFSASVPLTTAATGLGMKVAASTSEATFNTDFASGTWDVVIVDVPGSAVPAGVQSGMSAQIAAGRQVIFSYWDLDTSPTLQSLVGVTVARTFSTPLPLYPSASGLWTIQESLPTPVANYSDDAGDNGDVIVPVDPATSEILAYYDAASAEVSILTTFSGQVLVNGFLPWDFQSTDDDADGTSDMVELYANELVWMTGCVP